MGTKSINIKFPFQDSQKGFFLETNMTSKDAVISDLLHLLFTNKGERFYQPDFGTNLMSFLFEPNDGITTSDILGDCNDAIKKYIPNLVLNKIDAFPNEQTITISLYATYTQDVFQEDIFVQVQI